MTAPRQTPNELPLDASTPVGACPLASILCTEELRRRPSRPAEFEKENSALAALVSALADSPRTILQTLADKVLEVLHADSAGLSLLTKDETKFYWPAIAGAWGPHIGGGTPRTFGPCGDVLDRNIPMLFTHWERRYPYLTSATPFAEEGLLVPFFVNGKAVGTIWAITHDKGRKFDAEDLRLLESLGRFASAAYQAVESIEDLKLEIAAREKAEAEVRELARGLEAKIRRLVEANVVGIVMWNLEGAITEANDAFLRMVQYDREDLASGRARWTDLTPAEWRSHDERAIAGLKTTGAFQPFEKEYFRKDGSRVPVLLGGALFEGSGNEGVAFVLDLTERKKMEQVLRHSEEQYRVVVETANEAVVSIDEAGRIIFANRATVTLFGYSVAELASQPLMMLMAESFRPPHCHAIDWYLETGQNNFDWRSIEVSGRRKNGEEFPIEVSLGEVVKDGQRIFTGCIRDITERKKAEAVQAAQAQQASVRADVSAAFAEAANLKTTLNSCAEAIVRHLGAAFARIWTLGENENVLVLQASAGLYTRLDGAHARVPMGQLKIGRIAEEGKPHLTNDVPNDERVSDRDWAKREGMVAFAGYPLFVEGRVTGVLAMFARRPLDQAVLYALESVVDIIALGIHRKDAQDKLLQRERSLQLLTETIPQMIWSATASGAIDYCNRQILDYTGRREDQLRGDGWAEVIHPDDLPAMQESWRNVVANQLPFELEFRHRRADGIFRWCLSRAQPLRDEHGRVIRWYGSITDLDDWKRAQETARRTQAELAHVTRVMTVGELASSIAHEINQPLGAIVNYGNASLRLLKGGSENIEDVKHAIAKIVGDANRASAIIAHVRALSKKSPPEKVTLNIKELIGEVVTLARHELDARLIAVQVQHDENLPPVLGDRIQIQQVLLNLVMNGVEAMSAVVAKDRMLTVRTGLYEVDGQSGVLVRIQDSGVGLRQKDMSRLFEAFYTTKPTGLGMGLAISRSIAEAHGGKLWAEPNDGPGATFCFVLPAELPKET